MKLGVFACAAVAVLLGHASVVLAAPITVNGLGGGDLIDFQDATLAEVPEPASLAVWSLMGVAGLAYRWRRTAKRRS